MIAALESFVKDYDAQDQAALSSAIEDLQNATSDLQDVTEKENIEERNFQKKIDAAFEHFDKAAKEI